MTRLRSALPLLLAALAACSDDLPPRSYLDGLRVLALVAEPLEAGPGEAVTVRAVTYASPDAKVTSEAWSFCPFTLGATAGDACAVPACETPLLPVDGAVTADPGALALACLQAYAAGGGVVPSGLPSQLPDRLEVLFRYRVTAAEGASREAVLRVPLYPGGAPAERNAPPVVTRVELGGVTVFPGGGTAPPVPAKGELVVKVELAPASAERYVTDSGRTVEEALFTSFYTTAGRFDYDRDIGLTPSVKLKDEKVPPDTASASVWAVVRDDRGGVVVFGPYEVPFTR